MDKLHKLTVMLYGAGGHAAVVESAIMAGDDYYIFEVVDDQKPVGTKVLHESIRRFGGIENGLQQFGGALNDPDRRYASKVLAEKQRLEQATQRFKA